jgi:hypothetical protein
VPKQPYVMTDEQLRWCIDNCDDTAGYLIKESTIKYFIEYFVNVELQRRSLRARLRRLIGRK